MAARFVEGPVSDFVRTCVEIPRFLGCCRECPNYDKRWSCPPYDFSVGTIWNHYTSILLYEEKVLVDKYIQEKAYSQNELNEICRAILAPVKKQMSEDLLVLEKQNPGSRALFAGTCELCENCNREILEPCRHPELMRYSIEALGGNVAQAIRIYFDDEILWASNGHLPDYLLLLGGLLKVELDGI